MVEFLKHPAEMLPMSNFVRRVVGGCVGAAVGVVIGFIILTLLPTRFDLLTKIEIGAICGAVLGLAFPAVTIQAADWIGRFWEL